MTRMLLTTSAVTSLACAAMAWLLVQQDLTQIRKAVAFRGEAIARSLAQEIGLAARTNDARAVRRVAHTLRLQDDVLYVRFYDPNGRRVMTTTGPSPSSRRFDGGDPYVWEFRAPIVLGDVQAKPDDARAAPRRVQIGSVAIGLSSAFVYRHRREMIVTAAWFTLGVTLLASLLALVMAAAIVRPLAKLAAASDRVARGELTTVDVDDGAEIGRLARSFNAMVASVAQSRAALQDYNRTLEEKVKARTERLELTNRELEEASHLKTEFLATVSHELRTPLNVIIGHIDMVVDEAGDTLQPSQLATLATVRRYSLQQLELITNVLDFSRLASGKISVHLKTVDLGEVARDVRDMHTGRYGKGDVAIRLDVADDVPELITDRVKLQEIVRNLLDNAMKYTREGEVVIRARRADGGVRIEVQDTGCGIPAKDLPHIFDEFRQVSAESRLRAGGVGLGLTIVKRLVYVLNGTIAVASRPGVGTTFVVDLPIRHSTASAGTVEAA